MEYLRIGPTKYYSIRTASYPKNGGGYDLKKVIEPWKKGTIIDDHGKEFLKTGVAKYDTIDHVPADVQELLDQRNQLIKKGYSD